MSAEPGQPGPAARAARAASTASTARAASPASTASPASPAGAVEPAGSRLPASFEAEISAAVRYERGLAVKAVIVLAALGVILLLRALYFA